MSNHEIGSPQWLAQVALDPAATFQTPEEVVAHPGLSSQQKIDVLRAWEYDAAEAEVAEEEGMGGLREHLLQRILLSLGSLSDTHADHPVAPSKQHGLC
ncbi:MAG: hypothetical protein K0M67_23860 [Thiobacillus sp.]|nr:hypothetical protein [Thiobacillus sp.]